MGNFFNDAAKTVATGGINLAYDAVGGGDIFKSPTPTNQALTEAQGAFIMDQLSRNKELWPKMMDMIGKNNGDITKALSDLSGQYPEVMDTITQGAQKYQALADQASQGVSGAAEMAQRFAQDFQGGATKISGDQSALFDELSSALGLSRDQIQNLTLSPQAAAMLDTIKNSQMEGMKYGADKMVGSAVADLSRRGMMSSTTSEGSFRGINESLSPYMAQIQAEDAKRRIDLPRSMAMDTAGLAKDRYGAGITKTGIDMNLLNSIFGANMQGANAKRQGALDTFNMQGNAIKNTSSAATDKLNLAGNLFNTQANANQLQLSPWMQLYGSTAGGATASPAAPTYAAPSPFMQILPSIIQAGGRAAAGGA